MLYDDTKGPDTCEWCKAKRGETCKRLLSSERPLKCFRFASYQHDAAEGEE